MERHGPWMKRQASNLRRRLPFHVPLADLIAAGNVGLWQAAERYDANRSKFLTYASRRVRGEMMDWLRQSDFVCPRMRKKRERKGEFVPIVRQFQRPWAKVHGTDRSDNPDHENLAREPAKADLSLDEREAFDRHLRGLDPDNRMVLTLYFREGCTLREAGAAVGFSESRASQLLTQSLALLKDKLSA
jgi:RNA polymerase sigma factor for flagellar operon FliA